MGRFIAGFAASLLLALGGTSARATEIKLISSVGVRGVMEELVPAFEKSSGVKVNVVFGSAAALKTKIDAGETFDVAVLAPAQIDDAIKQGKAGGQRVDIAKAGCGVALSGSAPLPDISTDDKLKAFLLGAKSISYSDPALGGFSAVYFTKLITRLGIADDLKARTTYVQPGEGASLVAKGTAEVGVGLLSEIVPVKGVRAVPLKPDDPATFNAFAVAPGAGAVANDAAKALIAYLQSPAARQVIKAQGMSTPCRRGVPAPVQTGGAGL